MSIPNPDLEDRLLSHAVNGDFFQEVVAKASSSAKLRR
jgi:hypothetical protein